MFYNVHFKYELKRIMLALNILFIFLPFSGKFIFAFKIMLYFILFISLYVSSDCLISLNQVQFHKRKLHAEFLKLLHSRIHEY